MRKLMIAHLIETGEMERLKKLLKCRLIESGWREEMKAECKKLTDGKDIDKIAVNELVKEIRQIGREKVNPEVKEELLETIRTVLRGSGEEKESGEEFEEGEERESGEEKDLVKEKEIVEEKELVEGKELAKE